MTTIGSYYNFILMLIESGPENRLDPLLKLIGEALKDSNDRVKRIETEFPEFFQDEAYIDEGRVTEDLLGIAYVACQVFITEVVTSVVRLHKHVGERERRQLVTTSGKPYAIMRYGRTSRSASFSKVEVINSLANYYKHSDSWPRGWKGLTGLEARTAEIIRQAGAKPDYPYNLMRGAKYLGNKDHQSTGVFLRILIKWRDKVVADYRRELRKKGFHPTRRRSAPSLVSPP